jgi:hypothetical protein
MITELDMRSAMVYGWQGRISKPKLDSLCIAIGLGHELPAVDVIQASYPGGTAYMISNRKKGNIVEGGHHRSKARRITGTPLLVNIIGEDDDIGYDEMMAVPIDSIPVRDDKWAWKAYNEALERYPKYIPLNAYNVSQLHPRSSGDGPFLHSAFS